MQSKYDTSSKDFRDYIKKVHYYRMRFAELDEHHDGDYYHEEVKKQNIHDTNNFFGDEYEYDYEEPPKKMERKVTIEYDLSNDIDKIIESVIAQLNAVKDSVIDEKRNHYTITCTKYITNSKNIIISPAELFQRWEKYLSIYSRYKNYKSSSSTKHSAVKADLSWYRDTHNLRSVAEVMNYVKFIKELVVAANTLDGGFYKQAEQIFTKGKSRPERIGKRNNKETKQV